MKETKLELTKKSNLLALEIQCPQCNDKYLYGVPYVSVPCNKCGISYKTDFKMSAYTKVARRLESLLAWNDKVEITADEDYYHDIVAIEKNYTLMNCWDIEPISMSEVEIKYCESCGTCKNCFTCKKCGKSFSKDSNRRKQKCPHCDSAEFERTRFKDSKPSKHNSVIRVCPECGSDNIKITETTNKNTCSECGSKKISKPIVRKLYRMSIIRKKAYMIEQN